MRWLQSVIYILPSLDLTILQVKCNFTLTHLHLRTIMVAKHNASHWFISVISFPVYRMEILFLF